MKARGPWSLSPATAWRSPRRSIACAELYDALTKEGVDVKFAVASGRGVCPAT